MYRLILTYLYIYYCSLLASRLTHLRIQVLGLCIPGARLGLTFILTLNFLLDYFRVLVYTTGVTKMSVYLKATVESSVGGSEEGAVGVEELVEMLVRLDNTPVSRRLRPRPARPAPPPRNVRATKRKRDE